MNYLISSSAYAKITRPFGGMQVIFSGDFTNYHRGDEDDITTRQYCFESPYGVGIQYTCKIGYNVSRDPKYIKILNQIRCGKISRKTVDILNSHVGRKPEHH